MVQTFGNIYFLITISKLNLEFWQRAALNKKVKNVKSFFGYISNKENVFYCTVSNNLILCSAKGPVHLFVRC